VDAFFPKNLNAREVDASGWIFCSGGNVYIAVLPFKPYRWIEEKINWRLRSFHRKNGFILEVTSRKDYPSFDAFKSDIRQRTPNLKKFDRTLTVQFRTSDKNVMKFTYPDKRYLNGKAWDFSQYKLFHGPFTDAEVGSQKLLIHYRNQKYELDVKHNTIRHWVE